MLRRSHFISQDLSPDLRPPLYLRYVIAALAASIVENYHGLALTLYHQARLCVEEEELKVWWRNCTMSVNADESTELQDTACYPGSGAILVLDS